MTPKQLEREALDVFHAVTPWRTFWAEHGPGVLNLPDGEERARLVGKLFALVTSGELAGLTP
ncbi:MAG: hypothetical protein JXB10_18340 [Pirellulales bacterium]|nr:hypothetical protein [Pirellulales bacterium]